MATKASHIEPATSGVGLRALDKRHQQKTMPWKLTPSKAWHPFQIYRHAKTSHQPQKYPYLHSDNGAAVNLYVISQKCSVVKMGDGKILKYLPVT